MSIFQFPSSSTAPSFHPLFQLLDDFDNYSRGSSSQHHRHGATLKSFTPKFDVKELKDAYELHGELPGIDQKDVEIEFTDAQTLTVKGRTERSYTAGTPPAALEGGEAVKGAITGSPESHKATVEDDVADAAGAATSTTEVTKAAHATKNGDEPKYWVSERSVGEFSRSFSFPVRVNQDGVKASMKQGVLSIVVPKEKKVESRRIQIS